MTSNSILLTTFFLLYFKFDLIWMQLKNKCLLIFFIFILVILKIREIFKSTTSKEIIMLTFDDMKSRSLSSNQLFKTIMRELLIRASIKQSQLKVLTIKPCFKVIVVVLSINQKAIRPNN
jgi:hypothetical protein